MWFLRFGRLLSTSGVLLLSGILPAPSESLAASPMTIQQGKQLFEQQWPTGNPAFGGDGLGPLFNGSSCVTCHHQGGIGGGGDSRFNAKTLGIEQFTITGPGVTNDIVGKLLRSFYPGFVGPGGAIVNTAGIPHHGGSSALDMLRQTLMNQVPAEFSAEGGSSDASEVRRAFDTPILYTTQDGVHRLSLRARLFQRNTPALFGLGLVDEITRDQMRAQARRQEGHPEISGRPSTLSDGRFGRFGWRANMATLIEFTDQACANEVGLKTQRKPQPADPLTPNYRNPVPDISDAQIQAIHAFTANLPAPSRAYPDDKAERLKVARGEQVFTAVGCAVCHVPDMAPAKGLYSDMLLHDMGSRSYDLNHAEPYIREIRPVRETVLVRQQSNTSSASTESYHGGTTVVSRPEIRRSVSRHFEFTAPKQPTSQREIVMLDVDQWETRGPDAPGKNGAPDKNDAPRENDRLAAERERKSFRRSEFLDLKIEKTNFNQEWRTTPLWGLKDSAPYLHDGRAETVLEAISMHDGEAAGTRDRFLMLSIADRNALLAFLDTFVAPPQAAKPAS